MRIQTNIMAENTHRMYSKNNNKVSKSAEKLSSGYRINRAGDDAAGLAISEKMRAQVRGLNMASKNSQDAISLIQTAEGALQEVHSLLQRMNELANQAATGTNQEFDRQQIDAEFNQLKTEIDDISSQTTFNSMKLLDGSLSSGNSGAMVDTRTGSATTLAPSMTIGATGNKYTLTKQIGLSDIPATYTISVASSIVTVECNETATGNTTNTSFTIASVISGDVEAGHAFTLDLSATGLGMLSFTADGGNTAVNAATIATALNALKTVTIPADTAMSDIKATGTNITNGKLNGASGAPAGEYKIAQDGTTGITITNAEGITANVALSAIAGAGSNTIDLTNLNFNGETVNLGSIEFTSTGAVTIANQQSWLADSTITVADTNGGEVGALEIQVGANEGNQLSISIEKLDTKGLKIDACNIATQENAGKAITATRSAINVVSEQRATLGATQNRLEHKISNLDNTSENLATSESRIRDVDIAKEMTEYTKNNILSQAATAILSQANAAPQNVMSLFQ